MILSFENHFIQPPTGNCLSMGIWSKCRWLDAFTDANPLQITEETLGAGNLFSHSWNSASVYQYIAVKQILGNGLEHVSLDAMMTTVNNTDADINNNNCCIWYLQSKENYWIVEKFECSINWSVSNERLWGVSRELKIENKASLRNLAQVCWILTVPQGPAWQRWVHGWLPQSRVFAQVSRHVGASSVQGISNSRSKK